MAGSTSRTRKAPSKEVAVRDEIDALLPDLVSTTSTDDFQVDARDILAPRIKAASPASDAVSAGNVPLYSLFSQKGQDDEDPQVLVDPIGDAGAVKAAIAADPDVGLKVYVLKMYKNLSASVNPSNWQEEQKQGGELRTWAFGDPRAPQFAKVQYNYVLFVPDSNEPDMPHNLLLKSTSIGTARQMNSVLMKRKQEGKPLFVTAWRIVPEKRERDDSGQKQRWSVIRAREVEPEIGEVKAAAGLYEAVADRDVEVVTPDAVLDNVSDDAPGI